MEETITCANCQGDLTNKRHVSWFGFTFCLPMSTYDPETCSGQFTKKLWQAAAEARDKAREEAR